MQNININIMCSIGFTGWLFQSTLSQKKEYTIIIVTHNMQQAMRVSDYTGFMYLGDLIEFGETRQIFENPRNEITAKYVQGQFG